MDQPLEPQPPAAPPTAQSRTYSFTALVVQAQLGVILGAVLMALVSPTIISWWAAPPFDAQYQMLWTKAIEWAISRLLWSMLGGAVAMGLFLPLGLYLFWYRRK
jgi:hypothetical protein